MNAGALMTITEIAPRERVAALVRRILAERGIERAFSAEDDLREVGLTSLDMVNLVLAVESELAVSIPERDITPANFRSVSSIEALVTALRK
jgi:acyl carrier protein